jgi:antitoxin (DNA-binding transcriptional repressor) of toxin-antitoxin stability system
LLLGKRSSFAKAGTAVAKLVPVYPEQGKRPLGFLKGEIWMADDFNGSLPPDVLAGSLGEDEPEKRVVKKAHHPRNKSKRA